MFESQLSEAALTLLVWCARHEVRAGITYNLRRVCELAARRRGLVIANVTSAVELTQAQQKRLIGALAKRTGHGVELHLEVDPEVIGGLRILVDDRLYDNTTRSALKALRTQIA
ncbi:MAG: ATP synthase F1 subunit delta [Actinomyces graevenitzii]|nr:ATP synthase F1 subunit delta [Actinomyces graevenitzii]